MNVKGEVTYLGGALVVQHLLLVELFQPKQLVEAISNYFFLGFRLSFRLFLALHQKVVVLQGYDFHFVVRVPVLVLPANAALRHQKEMLKRGQTNLTDTAGTSPICASSQSAAKIGRACDSTQCGVERDLKARGVERDAEEARVHLHKAESL